MIFEALIAIAAAQSSPPVPACTPDIATPATTTEIARRSADFIGRCVTISGPSSGTSLFSGIDGIYLGQWPSVFDGRVSASHRIGLYSRNHVLRDPSLMANGPPHLTVTGRVDSCERLHARLAAANPDGLVMMGGYCHWFGGPYVDVAAWSVDPAIRYERLVGEAGRRRVGDLVPASSRTRGFAALRAFARDFLDAVRSRDRAALAALHGFSSDTRNTDDRRVLAFILDDPDSPFAQLRAGIGTTPAIFVRRDIERRSDEGVEGVLCFCRTGDCRNRWPISILDTGNSADQPYVCTIVEPRDWVARRGGLSTASRGESWLREPAQTAFRR